jgi:hypothetical protein
MQDATDETPADPRVPDGLTRLKERLQEILRRPVITARDAEEAGEAAHALADLIRGEERAFRLLDRGPLADPAERPTPSKPRGSLAGLPLHDAARRVLETAGWPMHVRDLGVRVKAGGWRHPRSSRAKPDQIQFQLAAQLARHPETFRKFAPNTFGLVSWGDSPPRHGRPQPPTGLFRSPPGSLPASRIDEELEHTTDDERNRWR